MAVFDLAYGSVLLDITGSNLTLRNVRSGGAITDTVGIQKGLPSSGVTIANLTVASGKAYVVVPAPPGLSVGSTVYIDRAYTFTSVPSSVQGAAYIQTANNDKTATSAAFLGFTVDQPVTVYAAYDKRLSPPSWLTTLGFTDSGQDLVTSDTTFDLFARSFPAGPITLGGNASTGGSMYSVIIQSEEGRPPRRSRMRAPRRWGPILPILRRSWPTGQPVRRSR